jgi:hypothetical protein
MNFSKGIFVLPGNEMIQDDAKSIGLWRFTYKFVPYYDTIILMFFKLTPHCSSFEVLIQHNRIESRVITGEALPLPLQLGPAILMFFQIEAKLQPL